MSRRLYPSSAFSLVELTLALGVAAFCLIAILGLLPVAVQTNQRAVSQTAAALILSSVAADLRSSKASSQSMQYNITFGIDPEPSYFDGEGKWTTSLGANSRYRLTVHFINGAKASPATFVNLKVTWPAAVDPTVTTPVGAAEAFAAFDQN